MIKYLSILEKEIVKVCFSPHNILRALIFFSISVTLFSITLGGKELILSRVSLNILWIILLFTSMLRLEDLYKDEQKNGHLFTQIKQYPNPYLFFLIKILSYWVTNIIPIFSILPIMCILLHIDTKSLVIIIPIMLISTLSLTLLSSIGSVLTLEVKDRSTILSLLIFPLYIPVLIFSVGCIQTILEKNGFDKSLLFVVGFLLVMLAAAPFVSYWILKMRSNHY